MDEVELVLGRLCPIVGLIGLLFNMIVVVVFSTRSFKEPILYKYLQIEAVLICFDLTITVFKPIYYCSTCGILTNLLVVQIYQVSNPIFHGNKFLLSKVNNFTIQNLVFFKYQTNQ